jgi:uncharacterized protein
LKLHAERIAHLNTVTAYGPGYIDVNGVRHHGNLILLPDAPVQAWNVEGFESLRPEDFDSLLASRPEVILFGTGRSQRFAPPRLTVSLLRARVAVEAMDTRAACRTFNILVSDGRRVTGAILQEPDQT